jgi:hypothetical protein
MDEGESNDEKGDLILCDEGEHYVDEGENSIGESENIDYEGRTVISPTATSAETAGRKKLKKIPKLSTSGGATGKSLHHSDSRALRVTKESTASMEKRSSNSTDRGKLKRLLAGNGISTSTSQNTAQPRKQRRRE